ncbi:MAG: hypothetical protein AAGC81_04490 [Pseudomonadota bacterium]
MIDDLNNLWNSFEGSLFWQAVVGVFGIVGFLLSSKMCREWLEETFEEEEYRTLYSKIVGQVLDRIDRWLQPSPPDAESEADRIRIGQHPFAWTMLERVLVLAAVYPVALAIAQWTAGGSGTVGDIQVLPDPATWSDRLLTLLGLVLFFAARKRQASLIGSLLQIIALTIAFVVSGLLVLAGALAGLVASLSMTYYGRWRDNYASAAYHYNYGRPSWWSFYLAMFLFFAAIASLIWLSIAGSFFQALVLVFAFSVGFGFAGAGAGLIILRGNLAILLIVIGACIFADPWSGIVAAVIALSLYILFAYLLPRRSHGGSLVVSMLIAVSIIVGTLSFGDFSSDRASAIFFLGVLPLVNTFFDYLSLGLTRFLLRKGVDNNQYALLCGLADLFAATFIFLLLGASMIAVVHGLNMISAIPHLDLDQLFVDMSAEGGWRDYFWLYAVIFSTMLPTFIHLSIASLSAITLIPLRPRVWVAKMMKRVPEKDPGAILFTQILLTIMAVWTLGVPLLIIGGTFWLLVLFHADMGRFYLDLFACWAAEIGAADTSCRWPMELLQ